MTFETSRILSEHRRQTFLAEADAHRRAHPTSGPPRGALRARRTRKSVRRMLPVRRWRPAYDCT